jgi:alpha-D-ribose 1-methylphosphonate 5-triphosphate diphosphatase
VREGAEARRSARAIEEPQLDDPAQFILTNAKVATAGRVFHGWVAIAQGRIVEVGEGRAPERGFDLDGDFAIPGLVELHTDHLEPHLQPRPKVRWDLITAILAYDAQMAAAGVTTVFDSLRVGAASHADALSKYAEDIASAIARASAHDLLRCDHLTHLRCEIATPDVVDDTRAFLLRHHAHLISLMDHTPGQRQFRDLDKLRAYYARQGHVDDAGFDAFVVERLGMHEQFAARNRAALVRIARDAGVPLASHDDATLDQVAEAVADGVSIAEFPTTLEAAEASHDFGLEVLMGAPNIVRGGSHSGNVAALDLAWTGRLDILSSDYVPASLLFAAFELPRLAPGVDLAHALRLVTKNPAGAAGLDDRGEIAPGKRADLVRVRIALDRPVVRCVWRAGLRVA